MKHTLLGCCVPIFLILISNGKIYCQDPLIEWDNTIGGYGSDFLVSSFQTSDGGYILGGYSNSTISGDKTEYIGNYDYWIVKLSCESSEELCNTLDDNCNGLIDDDVIETISISADGPIVFCPTDSVVLHAEFSGETIQWFKNGNIIPGATNAFITAKKKGFYTCETYSSCDTVSSNTIFVNELKGPPASILADGPITFCEGGSVTLSVNTGIMLSYQWYKNGDLIPGANSINYLATTEGNYKCMVIKGFTGCYKMSNTITVTVPCKTGEDNSMDSFPLYPNPTSSQINVIFSLSIAENTKLIIEDITGRIVLMLPILNSETEINVSHFSAGVYFIKLEGQKVYQKFIKL